MVDANFGPGSRQSDPILFIPYQGGTYVASLFAHIKLRAGKVQKFTEMLSVLAPLIARNKFHL